MPSHFASEAIYFGTEGPENLDYCVRLALSAVAKHELQKLVIFTAQGEGVLKALDLMATNPAFSGVRVVAVTFPQGKFINADKDSPYPAIPPETQHLFAQKGIPVVRAHLPFDPITPNDRRHGMLGQDFSLIGNALTIFCGGMSLCVQAALMACDAGEVELGEHIVTMASDTALLVRAVPTDHFLTDMVVREIICKPIFLKISRGEDVPLDDRTSDVPIPDGSTPLVASPESQ